MISYCTTLGTPLSALLAVLAGAMLTGCERPSSAINNAPAESGSGSGTATGDTATLQVEAFYRERMLLPEGSEVLIALEDVSRMDVAATRISEQVLVDAGAPPYRVTLSYPADQIDARHRYGMRAQIRNQGRLLFTTTSHIDPFAGEQPVQVLLERVPRSPTPSPSQ